MGSNAIMNALSGLMKPKNPITSDTPDEYTIAPESTGMKAYKNIFLPLVGAAEVIGTGGKSGGQTAMNQYKILQAGRDQQISDVEKAQDMKSKSLQRKLTETALQKSDTETAKLEAMRKKLSTISSDPKYKTEDEKATDIQNTVLGYLAENDPDKFMDVTQKLVESKAKAKDKEQARIDKKLDDVQKKKDAWQEFVQKEEYKRKNPTKKPAVGTTVVGYDEDGAPVYGSAGEKVSETTVKSLAEFQQFPKLLKGLKEGIDKYGYTMGPAAGRYNTFTGQTMGAQNQASLDVQALNAQYEAVKQIVAKGLEGGVLRAEDMPKYEKILGSTKLTPEVAKNNLVQLEGMLQDKFNNWTDALRKSGKRVPFDNMGSSKASGGPKVGDIAENPQTGESLEWNGQAWVGN